ncbi:MAG: hypothetical protein P4L71_20940 [Acetobacteraceae bacterium]|nr:hypothetical protein [Acetobacteraceae bacterium]
MRVNFRIVWQTLLVFIWIGTPFFAFETSLFSVAIIGCVLSMLWCLLAAVLRAVTGRLARAGHLAARVIGALAVIVLLAGTGTYPKGAFLLHMKIVGDYPRSCETQQFSMGDKEQTVGLCGVRHDWLLGDVNFIVLDTSGLIGLPASARSPEWRQAAGHLSRGCVVANISHPGKRIFRDYFDIFVSISDVAAYC